MNVYVELTHAFNAGALRAILSSGQAVVLHRLAVMSKDGDWILRESPEALDEVLGVLDHRCARYRFGAPLDVRWMRGGSRQLIAERPVLAETGHSLEALEAALDAERRMLIHANERRLQCYMNAAEPWAARWPAVEAEIAGLPLRQAHAVVVRQAEGLLPFALPEGAP